MKSKIFTVSLLGSLALASLPARADITGGGVLGAIAGGLLGSQVGQGNGRIASSALGAALGFNAGQSISQPYYGPPQGYYSPPQQPYYPPQPAYYPPKAIISLLLQSIMGQPEAMTMTVVTMIEH